MKFKFLILAFMALFFAACSVDQEETILDEANFELTQTDSSRNWGDGPIEINSDDEGCRSTGDQLIRIKFNFPLGGSSAPREWKQDVRNRFDQYGLVREYDETAEGETWHFVLDNMSPEHTDRENGCRNEVVRNAIRADKDVDIDNNHGCTTCLGN